MGSLFTWSLRLHRSKSLVLGRGLGSNGNNCDDPGELCLPKLAAVGFVTNLSMDGTAVMVCGSYLEGLVPFSIICVCGLGRTRYKIQMDTASKPAKVLEKVLDKRHCFPSEFVSLHFGFFCHLLQTQL